MPLALVLLICLAVGAVLLFVLVSVLLALSSVGGVFAGWRDLSLLDAYFGEEGDPPPVADGEVAAYLRAWSSERGLCPRSHLSRRRLGLGGPLRSRGPGRPRG